MTVWQGSLVAPYPDIGLGCFSQEDGYRIQNTNVCRSTEKQNQHYQDFIFSESLVQGWFQTLFVADDDFELLMGSQTCATIFMVCSAGGQTQGSVHAMQALEQLSTFPSSIMAFQSRNQTALACSF